MTVRLLTSKDIKKFRKTIDKETQKLRQVEYKKRFGTKKLFELSGWDRDDAEDIINNWDPFEDDYVADNPELEDFPACCGADVMCGFAYQNQAPKGGYKMPIHEEYNLTLRINDLLGKSRFTMAILNQHQQPVYKKIFERFGGECHPKTALGNTRNKLYLWIFIKGASRKKKRVFG